MHGATPTEPTQHGDEITIMKNTGWSWSELMTTPASVVDEVVERMKAEEHWRKEKHRLDKAMNGG